MLTKRLAKSVLAASVSFGAEREISEEIGKGLEASLKDAKKIDREIARSLNNTGLMSYVNSIPVVGGIASGIVTRVRSIKPLSSLESELRTSLNNSLVSLVRVGKRAEEEKERILQLNDIYDTSMRDNWGSTEFIRFIEANTDINYKVELDGKQIDMIELFSQADSKLSQERRVEKNKEYLDWFKQHINLSEQYLESMHALCFVGCEWIGGMTRSYFDLTQLRGGMEEIQTTLRNLSRGGTSSITSQQAIRNYGTAYINGMRSLMQGYRKMCDLKDLGSAEFEASLNQLRSDLNTPQGSKKIENKKSNSRSLIYNPN